MPENTAPESQLTSAEVFHGYKTAERPEFAPERVKPLAKNLEESQATVGGRKTIEMMGKGNTRSENPAEDMKDSWKDMFGTEAENKTTNTGLTKELAAVRTEAEDVLADLSAWEKYSQLLDEAEQHGQKPEDYAEANSKDYDTIRTAGLDALMSRVDILSLDPETFQMLKRNNNSDQIKVLLDARLVRDPSVRAEIHTRIQQAKDQISSTDVPEDEDVKEAQRLQGERKKDQEDTARSINQLLSKNSLPELTPEEKTTIEERASRSKNQEAFLNDIRFELMSARIPRWGEFNEYDRSKARLAKQIETVNNLDPADSDYARQTQLRDALQQAVDNASGAIEGTDEYEKFNNLNNLLSSESRTATNTTLGELTRKLSTYHSLAQEINTAESQLNILKGKSDTERAGKLRERLKAEKEALKRLKETIPAGVSAALLERLDKLMAQEQIQLEKETDTDKRTFRQAAHNRWIGFDRKKGQRLVNKDRRKNIIDDVRYLASMSSQDAAEEGLKDIGVRLFFPERSQATYNQLTPEGKKQFDRVWAQEGDWMKQKLFRDLYAQRELMGRVDKMKAGLKELRPGADVLGLTKDQWGALGGEMQAVLRKGGAEAQKASQLYEQLKAEGVIKSDRKSGMLLALLLILTGVTTVALAPGVGGLTGMASAAGNVAGYALGGGSAVGSKVMGG